MIVTVRTKSIEELKEIINLIERGDYLGRISFEGAKLFLGKHGEELAKEMEEQYAAE